MSGEVLIDTHVLLWVLAAPEKLSERARGALKPASETVLVSTISAFEIANKYRIGKLPEAEAMLFGYESHLSRLRITSIPLDPTVAVAAGTIEWDHRDPFDRIIGATALLRRIPLVSADAVFDRFPGVQRIW